MNKAKAIIQKIRQSFIGYSLREQVLLLSFIAIIVGLWVVYLKNNWQENSANINLANDQLSLQQQILDASPVIKSELDALLNQFDHTKTFALSQLTARIDRIARQANVSVNILPSRTRTGEVFNTHQLVVQIKQKKIDDIIRFNNLLQQENPYIRLEELKVSPLKSNRNLLSADFVIKSFELDSDALKI